MLRPFLYIYFIFLFSCKEIKPPPAGPAHIQIKADNDFYLKDSIHIFNDPDQLLFYIPTNLLNHLGYYYRLEKDNASEDNQIDNQWNYTTNKIIRYTNLPGGDFTFKISLDSLTYKVDVRQTFEIKKAFFETWWFWPFVILSLLGIGALVAYFWYLYDFRQQMKSNYMRQRIAADLHDEVGSNLSTMTFNAELIKKKLNGQSADIEPILNNLLQNSRDTSSLISDTIWAINPAHDSFDKLLDKMKSFTQDLLASKEIKYTIEKSGDGAPPELSIEQKRNLYLIYKEAINNIAKHSRATEANILVELFPSKLQIEISDNGVGFDINQESNGNGMNNFKSRADNETIKVHISSVVGHGTKIHIEVLYFAPISQ